MGGISFATLYEHEDAVTAIVLVILALLLIVQVIFAGKYLRKRVGKRNGVLPLTVYSLLLVGFMLGCGVVADRLPVRFGQRDTMVWYPLFTIIVVFFFIYIGLYFLTLLFGWIVRHWRDWRRKRKKKARYVHHRELQ